MKVNNPQTLFLENEYKRIWDKNWCRDTEESTFELDFNTKCETDREFTELYNIPVVGYQRLVFKEAF